MDVSDSQFSRKSMTEAHRDDVMLFVENIEEQVGKMEKAGWLTRNHQFRGWIHELRSGCLGRDVPAFSRTSLNH